MLNILIVHALRSVVEEHARLLLLLLLRHTYLRVQSTQVGDIALAIALHDAERFFLELQVVDQPGLLVKLSHLAQHQVLAHVCVSLLFVICLGNLVQIFVRLVQNLLIINGAHRLVNGPVQPFIIERRQHL